MTAEARGAPAPRTPDRQDVKDLVKRAADGDQEAWEALVERYSPLLWAICRRHELADADARDVSQTVWLQLLEHLGGLRDPAALPGWLSTTTRRECQRAQRTAKRPVVIPDDETWPDEHAAPADQDLLAAERHLCLRDAFGCLPPQGQRLIALLLADPPLSYAEISARLDIPVGSIGPNRRRYLDKLRQHPAIAALMDNVTG